MAYTDPEKRRAYHNAWHKEQYANDPAYKKAFKARTHRRHKRRDKIVADMLIAFRATGCIVCPEKEPCCLVAHHIDSAEKDFALGVARYGGHGRMRVMRELAKCVCLCANCHAKLHASVIAISRKTLRVSAKRAMMRVMAVEAEACEQIAAEVREHHARRKRRHGLASSSRRETAHNGFKLPSALTGKEDRAKNNGAPSPGFHFVHRGDRVRARVAARNKQAGLRTRPASP